MQSHYFNDENLIMLTDAIMTTEKNEFEVVRNNEKEEKSSKDQSSEVSCANKNSSSLDSSSSSVHSSSKVKHHGSDDLIHDVQFSDNEHAQKRRHQ